MVSKLDFYNIFSNEMPGGNSDCNDIYFEPIHMDGLEDFHSYSTDTRLYEFFEFEVFSDISETKKYINKLLGRMSGELTSRTASYWFVRRSSDGCLIGTSGLRDLNYSRKSVGWGYGIDPKFWGNGYVLQIQEILKKFAFDTLGLNRIHGITMVNNHRTIQPILAAGMAHEGTALQYYSKNGKFIDGWRYAMTRSMYEEQKQLSKVNVELDDILKSVVELVAGIFTEEDITENASMVENLSWDSLGHVQVIISLKENMGVELAPADIAEATSIKSIVDIIKAKNTAFS